ncbi:Nucleolar GTP-binding protein 1 [Forsythia ovata]|uniref:Nucleolar GTP-binding protein 1 n=1 Tax=Forsythia ovata TaxID=205694 RepID=A0ABD1VL64_9LAMI
MKSKKLNDYLNRFHVAMIKPRDQKERPPCMPKAVLEDKTKKAMQAVDKQFKLEKDLDDDNRDAGIIALNCGTIWAITQSSCPKKQMHNNPTTSAALQPTSETALDRVFSYYG